MWCCPPGSTAARRPHKPAPPAAVEFWTFAWLGKERCRPRAARLSLTIRPVAVRRNAPRGLFRDRNAYRRVLRRNRARPASTSQRRARGREQDFPSGVERFGVRPVNPGDSTGARRRRPTGPDLARWSPRWSGRRPSRSRRAVRGPFHRGHRLDGGGRDRVRWSGRGSRCRTVHPHEARSGPSARARRTKSRASEPISWSFHPARCQRASPVVPAADTSAPPWEMLDVGVSCAGPPVTGSSPAPADR